MSLLFGVFNKRGEPVDGKWLELMAATTRLPRCQEPRIWIDGSFGFGITQRFDTPQDPLVAQPLHDDTAGVHIIATGRLDYRNDLARKLGIAEQNLDLIADVTLIHLAWLKWQQDCALHLEGDWTMAVWDIRQHNLSVMRDSTGISAVHYVDHADFFAFATRIDSLLALPLVTSELNFERLTEILAICAGNGVATCYRDVKRLAPATLLTVGTDKRTCVRTYRDPLEADSSLPAKEDHFEQFVTMFEQAVAERMRSYGSVGLTLSSGFDSSSVAVAANKLATRRGFRINAYSAVPIDANCEIQGRLANESPLIRQTVGKLSQLDVHFSDAADVTPIQGMIDAIRAFQEPSHAVVNHYWIVSLLRQAARHGVTTLLTGQLGNATISWQGDDVRAWDNLLAGDFRSARARWQRSRNRHSFLRTMKSEVVSPVLRRLRLGLLPTHLANKWIASSFVSPSNPHLPAVKTRLVAQRRQVLRDPRRYVIRVTTIQANSFWDGLSHWNGVSIRDPTSDERIIKFCLSLPDSQYQSASEQRLLAGRYLQNAGLDWVVDSPTKGFKRLTSAPDCSLAPAKSENYSL